jgi:hypothetical protein
MVIAGLPAQRSCTCVAKVMEPLSTHLLCSSSLNIFLYRLRLPRRFGYREAYRFRLSFSAMIHSPLSYCDPELGCEQDHSKQVRSLKLN